MRVEAVILSYKNFQRTTKLCLDTIIPQIKNTSIRLSVFDNASPDNTQEQLKIYHNQNNQNNQNNQFNLILNSENLGFAGGFNKIFKNLDADWYPKFFARIQKSKSSKYPRPYSSDNPFSFSQRSDLIATQKKSARYMGIKKSAPDETSLCDSLKISIISVASKITC